MLFLIQMTNMANRKERKLYFQPFIWTNLLWVRLFVFAMIFQTNPLKIHTNHWSSVQSGGVSYKTSTTVLLKPDQTFYSFGYDAEDKYAELYETEEHEE